MTPAVERGATTLRLRQAAPVVPRSNGKNYRNIFCLLKPGNGGSSRNARLVREAPVAHNKARRPTKSPPWPRRSRHAHAHTRTRTGGNTSRIRMDQTLPCCTTNESPSLALSPSTLPRHSASHPYTYEPFDAGFLLQSGSSRSNVYRAYWNSR